LNVESALTLGGMTLVKQDEFVALQQQFMTNLNRLNTLESRIGVLEVSII
jgi:BMFP domain-containing protein YqiC